MQLTAILLLVCGLTVSAKSISQNVSFSGKNVSIFQVIEAIQKQTGFTVFAKEKTLHQVGSITVEARNMDLKAFLQLVFTDSLYECKITEKSIFLKRKRQPSLFIPQQNTLSTPVTGIIKGPDGQPLAHANITVKGTKRGTTSDANGNFSIEANEGDQLLISLVGYREKTVFVKNGSAGSVQLTLDEVKLDEVQIIGYGTTTKRLNTGNVATVKSDEIARQPVNNPLLALQGRVAGMEIVQSNGIAGSQVKIKIRGINSLKQGADPLFIIDGVPFNSNMFNTANWGGLGAGLFGSGTGDQNLGANPLSMINPQDIERIDILKDADATAIYGSRGANGVVLITTRKAKAEATGVNINFQQGVGEISRNAKLLNTEQYLALRNQAFLNDDIEPTEFNAKDLKVFDQKAYTDWQKVMIGGQANYTNAQIGISGGSANTQFLLSANYNRQTTVFPGDWSDRKGGVHLNLNHSSANQKLKINSSIIYTVDKNQLPLAEFTNYILLAPNAPALTNADGTLNWEDHFDNPFKFRYISYASKSQNLLASSTISYNLRPNLQFKTAFGFNRVFLDEKTFQPITSNNPAQNITTASGQFNYNEIQSYIIEPQIDYHKSIGKGSLNVMIGGTFQKRMIDGHQIFADGYTSDEMLGSLAGAATIGKGQAVAEDYRYASAFARIGYQFSSKYILNLTARRDGSSRFGPGNQFGDFGAIGAGWIFSDESFFHQLKSIINYGKLRVSYGTSGIEPGRNYEFLERYNTSFSLPYSGTPGIFPANLSTPSFRWEINRKFETGIEMDLLNNRIKLTTSFYTNRSSNQLIDYLLPPSVGFNSVLANLPATIQNAGVEITLNTKVIERKNIQWNAGFNISKSHNKLIDYPGLPSSPYKNIYVIGEPVTILKVFRSAGIDPSTGRYQFLDVDNKQTLTPSDADLTGIVNTNPSLFGGFQNMIGFKKFTLNIDFQFVKQTGRHGLYATVSNPGRFNSFSLMGNQSTEVLKALNARDGFAQYQRISQTFESFDSYDLAKRSDLAYADASFIRLQNIAVSYNVIESNANLSPIKQLRVFLHAQNLLTFTKYKGSDPETQNLTTLPPLKIVTAGIQLNF